MSERSTPRLKRSDDVKPVRKPAGDTADVTRLKGELAAAKLRIAELEKRQVDIINRIDWVIDSLHNLTD